MGCSKLLVLMGEVEFTIPPIFVCKNKIKSNKIMHCFSFEDMGIFDVFQLSFDRLGDVATVRHDPGLHDGAVRRPRLRHHVRCVRSRLLVRHQAHHGR